MQKHLKILKSIFLFIHHKAKVGIGFNIVKPAIQVQISVAKLSNMVSILLCNTVKFAPCLKPRPPLSPTNESTLFIYIDAVHRPTYSV